MRGYALNIGVGQVDHTKYGNKLSVMSCERDANSFHSMLEKANLYDYLPEPLINDKATSSNFFSELSKMASKISLDNEEAYVVLTFSGHGMSYLFDGQKEKLELLCFHDRMVLEHEIINALYQFSSSTHIFIVLDACHSNGIAAFGTNFLKDGRIVKSLSKNQIQKILMFGQNETIYSELVRNTKPRTNSLLAKICVLSACGKEYTTTGYNDSWSNSVFTEAVIDKIKHEKQISNHTNLFYELLRNVPYPKGPRMIGDNNIFFESHKPFIYNQKPKTMDWDIAINTDSSSKVITCNLQHPGGKVKAGSIIETIDKNHHLLSGKQLDSSAYSYQDGDTILILILDKNHSKEATYEQNTAFQLNRQLTTIEHPKMFAIAFDNTPGNKKARGNGKRSSHKVSDELGGN